MKNKLSIMLTLLCMAGATWAAWVHSVILANDPAVSTNKAYVLDLNKTPNQSGIDRLSAQAVYSISAGSTATYAGTVTMQWLGSNDGINYNAVNVSSVTYPAVGASSNTAISSLWDFGYINYHFIKLSVVAPTGGSLKLVVTVDERN